MHWVIDGNNVMGAAGDGWWNDPPAAAARLTQRVAEWCRTHEDPVNLVFDGRSVERVAELAGGNLEVRFANSRRRDAADDLIVDLVEDLYAGHPRIRVVTSDKGLAARLAPGVGHMRTGEFRRLLGL